MSSKCTHDQCQCPALRHAIVGLPITEALRVGRTYEIAYTSDHFDLCETHLGGANVEYVHFAEYELGACPTAHA